MGPTPPGTGVITEALGSIAAKSTSPQSLPSSGFLFTPTSITTVPSDTISAVTNFGLPIATTSISALRVTCARSAVLEWHIVTVAFLSSSSLATGRPTIWLLPSTTALFPLISTPASSSILMMPFGVQATVQGRFIHRPATLSGWKPSTSLERSIAEMTLSSLICFGSGSWTRIPSTASSAFRPATRSRSSCSEVSSGRSMTRLSIPTTSAAFALPLT